MPEREQKTVQFAFDSLAYQSLDSIISILTSNASVKRGRIGDTQTLTAWKDAFCPADRDLEKIELVSMTEDEDTGIITAIRQETWAKDDQSILLEVTGEFKVNSNNLVSQWHDAYDQDVWDSLD